MIGKTVRMIAVVGALAALMVQPALADRHEKDDYAKSGGYVGGAFALGLDNFDGPSADVGTGLDFWGGFRFAKFLALEGQFQWIPGMKVGGAEFKPMVYTGNLRGYLPLGRFQPFALVGIGGMTLDGPGPGPDTTDFAAKFGAGLDFYLTQQLALVATWNYVLATGALDGFSFNTVSFGAQYKF